MSLEFSSLMEYMKYVANCGLLNLRPPENAIFLNKIGLDPEVGIRSVILDRRGQFQTELFLASQEVKEAAIHNHPGVDSYELFVAGDFLFSINGESNQEPGKSDGRRIGENELIPVMEDCAHGAPIMNGACFLSFQHWKEKSPTTAGDSFEIV